MKHLIAIAFLGGIAVPALAQNAPQVPGIQARTTAATYASMAASADNYEIQSSEMALGAAANPDVRAFAQMMIADHGRTSAELMAAAKAASVGTTNLLSPEADMLKALRGISRDKMEHLYVDQQVKAQEKALALHQGYAAQGDNPGLRAVASAAVPVVQHHLDEIRRIQAAMGGPMGG
jgi:putative membrane protein